MITFPVVIVMALYFTSIPISFALLAAALAYFTFGDVITSYSIHYTKLYDICGIPPVTTRVGSPAVCESTVVIMREISILDLSFRLTAIFCCASGNYLRETTLFSIG